MGGDVGDNIGDGNCDDAGEDTAGVDHLDSCE